MWWLYWSCCPLLSSDHSKTICHSQLRSDIKEESARAVAKQPDLPDVAQESGDLTPEQQGQMKTPSSNYVHRIIAFLDRHVHNATHWLQIRDTVIHTRPDMKVRYVKVYIYDRYVCMLFTTEDATYVCMDLCIRIICTHYNFIELDISCLLKNLAPLNWLSLTYRFLEHICNMYGVYIYIYIHR